MDNTATLPFQKMSSRVLAGRAFVVKTPMCEAYAARLITWLSAGAHGAIVLGFPRLGKTSATRWVLDSLAALLGGPVPWVEIPVRQQVRASEREFFQHVLTQLKHRHAREGTAGDKRDRLTEALANRALRSTVNSFIFFIDEAHLLKDIHFQWLLNISNELDSRGCRLFCLLVGQRELAQTKQRLVEAGQEQIIGRFMINELPFTGVKTVNQLKSCFREFDLTIYPSESNQPFCSSFLPKAISMGGFSLESISETTWSAFERLAHPKTLSKSTGIPMHYVTSFVLLLLNILSKTDPPSEDQVSKAIMLAADRCGYRSSTQALTAFSA